MDTDVKLHGDAPAPTGVPAGAPAGQAKPEDAPATPVVLKDRRIGRWRGTSKE
jgi:hypothetical protein